MNGIVNSPWYDCTSLTLAELEHRLLSIDNTALDRCPETLDSNPDDSDTQSDAADNTSATRVQTARWAVINSLAGSWQRLYQSPVDKTVHVIRMNRGKSEQEDGDQSNQRPFKFHFDADKGFMLDPDEVVKPHLEPSTTDLIKNWLGVDNGKACLHADLTSWLETGTPLAHDSLEAFRARFDEMCLTTDKAHNIPICRLVRIDQLRYDPHYQAVYQITPAQMPLMSGNVDERNSLHGAEYPESVLNRLRNNQHVFWHLSEDLQAAIAMFDSDLGKPFRNGARDRETEFLRIETDGTNGKPLTPQDLNRFSSYRYWAPPITFARSVFHMLFWRPLITGQDLFKRKISGEDGEPATSDSREVRQQIFAKMIKNRAKYYRVAINQYQAASYRLTDYGRAFSLLAMIADQFWRRALRHSSRKSKAETLDESISIVGRIEWTGHELGSEQLLARLFRSDQQITLPVDLSVVISLPFDELSSLPLDLSRQYNVNGNTTVGAVLKLLRDRMLQLMLWARSQMEIRSVGNVPINRLYTIDLHERLIEKVADIAEHYHAHDTHSHGDNTQDDAVRQHVNREMISMLTDGIEINGEYTSVDELITLKKDFDRPLGGSLRATPVSECKKSRERTFHLVQRDLKARTVPWLRTSRSDRVNKGQSKGLPSKNLQPPGTDLEELQEESSDVIPPVPWSKEKKDALGNIKWLECLTSLIWYYRRVRSSIRHLAGDKRYQHPGCLADMTHEQVRDLRRYINTDLHSYSLEFFLQRRAWARPANHNPKQEWSNRHPAQEPKKMRRGFLWNSDESTPLKIGDEDDPYAYETFLAETISMFAGIHAHLVSINRSISDLHYYVTELPFAAFTPVGKSEVRHMTKELDRIMTAVMVATHLQPRNRWQADLTHYLVTRRGDCLRLQDTISRYYQSHRIRMIIFPIDAPVIEPTPELIGESYGYPIACLPWTSGVYLDFLSAYQSISRHVQAIIEWSIRLHSLYHFVPRRVLRVIAPANSY